MTTFAQDSFGEITSRWRKCGLREASKQSSGEVIVLAGRQRQPKRARVCVCVGARVSARSKRQDHRERTDDDGVDLSFSFTCEDKFEKLPEVVL